MAVLTGTEGWSQLQPTVPAAGDQLSAIPGVRTFPIPSVHEWDRAQAIILRGHKWLQMASAWINWQTPYLAGAIAPAFQRAFATDTGGGSQLDRIHRRDAVAPTRSAMAGSGMML